LPSLSTNSPRRNDPCGSFHHSLQSFALDATLADLSTGAILGDIIVFRQDNPAATYVGSHSYAGSTYTNVRLDRWGSRNCSVVLESTVIGSDLQYLATANGSSCSSIALLVRPSFLWNRAGNISSSGINVTVAQPAGFADVVTVRAIGTQPVPFSHGGPLSWALPLAEAGTESGVVGYSTGTAGLSLSEIQTAILSAAEVQAAALLKWGTELAPVYEPIATIIAWNTIYTPYEGVVTPVSRGWNHGESGSACFCLQSHNHS
jgi:hypothetical protein